MGSQLIRYRLEMSQHPENHYGRMTLSVRDSEVTAYLKNEAAHELYMLLQKAYALGREDALFAARIALESTR